MSRTRCRQHSAARPVIAVGLAVALVVSLVVGVPGSPASANGAPYADFPEATEDLRLVARPVEGEPFTDVSPRASFAVATGWLVDQDITQGNGGPGRFSPNAPVTRRQMALFLWRLVRSPEATESCGFADVVIDPAKESDVELEVALCWLFENGVTTGVGTNGNGDPLYDPSGTVTRSQMARFLWRLAGARVATALPPFTDVAATGEVRDAVNWLAEYGITTGTSPTTFTPRGTVTRGQMAAFLYRLAVNGDAWNPGVRVTGSVEQISVSGAPGTQVSLYDAGAMFLENATLDIDGGYLWRSVAPGVYTVAVSDGEGGSVGSQVVVTSQEDPPPPSTLYSSQTLRAGFNYITTRDGTQLSAMVTFPSGPGPYPTLVEYSGYDLSDPYNPTSGSSPYRLLAPPFGYALVQVQMRGTGCSGGAFDYFEPLQNLDGYDAIETVAAQNWVKPNAQTGRKVVGTVGISYPGISQLFLASTAPPSLAAITPVSVVADMARSVLRPGGILNDGFAVSWAEGAVGRARPARQTGNPAVNGGWTGGVPFVARKINEGDSTCRLNQRLHGQAADLIGRIDAATFELPTDEYLSPMRLVGDIKAATLMVGSWQDEQTGGMWPILASQFDPDTYVRLIAQNGTHIEPIMPDNLKAAFEHLAMFVKGERPNLNVPLLNGLVGVAAGFLIGSGTTLTPEGQLKFTASQYDDRSVYPRFADAYQDYLGLPRLTVRFENGAGPNGGAGGSLVPAESRHFSGFPLVEGSGPEAEATERTWYLRGDGSLVDSEAQLNGSDPVTYTYRPEVGPTELWTGAAGCSDWEPMPTDDTGASCYNWVDPGPGDSASFIAAPFTTDTFMIGGGLVDLSLVWNPTGTPEEDYADVEVTISEVRPDGKEVYVQSGWARTFYCEFDLDYSLPRLPWATATAEDGEACALSPGEERRVQVPIFPFGHIFRAGSKLRLSVDSPGGSRVLWNFISAPDAADITLELGTDGRDASTLKLPIVTRDLTPTRSGGSGVRIWSPRTIAAPRLSTPPACGVLRSQPCRTYTAPTPP